MAIKYTGLDSSNNSAFIHHLVIKCCLGLMRLHSSIPWFVTCLDGLQIWTSILSLSVSCPLCSFCCHLFGQAKEYKWFWRSNCLRFLRFLSNHHKCDATFSSDNWHLSFSHWSRGWKFLWNFPRLDFRFFLFEKPFSSFLSFFNLYLWSQKLSNTPNFILVSFFYFESPLMVDFLFLLGTKLPLFPFSLLD